MMSAKVKSWSIQNLFMLVLINPNLLISHSIAQNHQNDESSVSITETEQTKFKLDEETEISPKITLTHSTLTPSGFQTSRKASNFSLFNENMTTASHISTDWGQSPTTQVFTSTENEKTAINSKPLKPQGKNESETEKEFQNTFDLINSEKISETNSEVYNTMYSTDNGILLGKANENESTGKNAFTSNVDRKISSSTGIINNINSEILHKLNGIQHKMDSSDENTKTTSAYFSNDKTSFFSESELKTSTENIENTPDFSSLHTTTIKNDVIGPATELNIRVTSEKHIDYTLSDTPKAPTSTIMEEFFEPTIVKETEKKPELFTKSLSTENSVFPLVSQGILETTTDSLLSITSTGNQHGVKSTTKELTTENATFPSDSSEILQTTDSLIIINSTENCRSIESTAERNCEESTENILIMPDFTSMHMTTMENDVIGPNSELSTRVTSEKLSDYTLVSLSDTSKAPISTITEEIFESTTVKYTTDEGLKFSTKSLSTENSVFPIDSHGTLEATTDSLVSITSTWNQRGVKSTTKELTTENATFPTYSSEILQTTDSLIISTSTEGYCEVANISLTQVNIETNNSTWKIEMENSLNEPSCNLTLFLSCEPTNEYGTHIASKNQTVTTKISSITISNLSPFTNYSCIFEFKNDDEELLKRILYNFTTEFDVPSKVDFNITNVTTNSFNIQWLQPSSFLGNSKLYHIIIVDKGPQHVVREQVESQNASFIIDNEKMFYTFDKASPNCLYEIQIIAGNERGNSTVVIQNVTTNSSYSTAPMNVSDSFEVISNHCDGTEYNYSLHIRWELPLNTNGKLKYFEIEFIGKSYFNRFSTEINNSNVSYHLVVPNLNASSIYNYRIIPITVENIHGSYSNVSLGTPDGCPSPPTGLVVNNIGSSGFDVSWKKAEEIYGKILKYKIEIVILGYNHSITDDIECYHTNKKLHRFETSDTFWKFVDGEPDCYYKIAITANTTTGSSANSVSQKVTTQSNVSSPLRNVSVMKLSHKITENMYDYYVELSFKKPCNTNGPFSSYSFECYGYREGYPVDNFTYVERSMDRTTRNISLKNPEYTYFFKIIIITDDNYKTVYKTNNLTTVAGVPPANAEGIRFSMSDTNPSQIQTFFNKKVFNNSNGNIMYYAIILMRTNGSIKPKDVHYGEWNGSWPLAIDTDYANQDDIFQLTPNRWNPFNDSIDEVVFFIGKTSDCQLDYCHNLLEDTNYILVTRGLTLNTYRDIHKLIKTGKSNSNLWVILTLICFCFLLFVAAIYLYSKKGQSIRIKFKRISNATNTEELPRHIITVKNISSYYNKITDEPEIWRQQYKDIEDEIRTFKEKHVRCDFALKPENKRKNRYINILPYDENRIKLNMDEDDEISSDYINASYIKGYSGEIEYIASQGPLEHTCKDFWKMVIQENVSVIVMVSHFVEKEKEKCFKYFPKNYENMLICEDLEVKCLTELQFDTYCVRTLLVRKNIKQYTVVHMQYLDWPDFGCPSGTSNMLFFCQEVRDRIKLEKGLMIVHCSAGVGRTGTLISLDILLQAVKKKKEISIFDTVMQLRKQRTHMVQTEKQYFYIHTCIKDALENESIYLRDDTGKSEEHIYKNSSFHEGYLKGASGTTEQESAF